MSTNVNLSWTFSIVEKVIYNPKLSFKYTKKFSFFFGDIL